MNVHSARFRAVVFDFDGVIADSMPAHSACWQQAVDAVLGGNADHVGQKIQDNLFSGYAGARMFEGIDLSDIERQALRAHKDALWEARAPSVPPMPFCRDVLPSLARRVPLAIATTARRDYVSAILARENLLQVFTIIMTNQDVPNPKPASDMLDSISAARGISANAMCMVGDTPLDRQMAAAAGCAFIWFGASPLAGTIGQAVQPMAHDWNALAGYFADCVPQE